MFRFGELINDYFDRLSLYYKFNLDGLLQVNYEHGP